MWLDCMLVCLCERTKERQSSVHKMLMVVILQHAGWRSRKGRGELQMRNEGVRLNESKENVVNGETKLLLEKQSKINGREKTEKAK